MTRGGCLAHDRERLDQQVVESLAALDAAAELCGLGAQRVVAERLHGGGLCVDVGNQAFEGLQLLTFTSSEDAIEDAHAGMQPTGRNCRAWPPPTQLRRVADCRRDSHGTRIASRCAAWLRW